MVGIPPVDELFTEINLYVESFRQRNSETVKEYVDREEFVWNRLCDAIRSLDGSDAETEVEPL
eukprot:7626419-Lingulodinium_polyedra.AAC.1